MENLLKSREIIQRLNSNGVDFVLVGGMAAILHGLTYVTYDIDFCAPLEGENLRRIIDSLADLNPRQRMNFDKPLPPDLASFTGLRNLYLRTDLGVVDFLTEISGVGNFEAVVARCITMDLAGVSVRLLDVDGLIDAKTAAGRDKDKLVLPSLRALKELKAGRGKAY